LIPEEIDFAAGVLVGVLLGTFGGMILMAAIASGRRPARELQPTRPALEESGDWSRP
jgi:hypothetical protein